MYLFCVVGCDKYTTKMFDERDQLGFFILVILMIALVLLIRKYLQFKKQQFKNEVQERHRLDQAHQQGDIFNISSRVPQGEPQWPTHDAHLSIEHIAILNELNKPPKYNDAPPSYEEALRIAESLNNNTQHQNPSSSTVVPVIPKTTTTD